MNVLKTYRVLVVEDHHMMILGLKALTEASETLDIQWLEAGNLADALALFGKHEPVDLVMLDLNLPDSQGLKSVERFQSKFPDARIAIYSATEDEFVMRQALAMGIIGFIPKSLPSDAMLELLVKLLTGEHDATLQELGPALLTSSATPHSSSKKGLDARDVLTPTQLKILELLLKGLTNRQIADECQLALGTVKNAVSAIMLAMNVNSRSQLISLFR